MHGLTGAWGGISAEIGSYRLLGGLGWADFLSQFSGTVAVSIPALGFGLLVFFLYNLTGNLRAKPEWEKSGLDSALLRIPYMGK
ncbi:MAG: hypothetical protein NUV68_01120 [Caldiserica bacterium]|nr:hypothetical protein [Caldisericota bacterium]MDH7561958.1 hypothetical protein [Caldisericota bacterium]